MRFDLIIFDCDGVLVDSEPITSSIFASMLCDVGCAISFLEVQEKFTGLPDTAAQKLVHALFNKQLPEDFWPEFNKKTLVSLKEKVTTFPGVHDLVNRLGINCCVASGGSFEKINTTLGATELLPKLEGRIFSGSQVARGKPNPDLYLFAASQMKIEPSRCAVIEDSVYGIQAANAAGMKALGFAPNGDERLRALGALMFREFQELSDYIFGANC